MNRSFTKTFTYIKRLAEHTTFGKIAAMCGKEIGTAEAWGREPESNATPTGTGKRNPIDCVIRLIALAHRDDPGLAREMAEIFPDYVDYLDGKCGSRIKDDSRAVNEILGCSAKEHTDVMLEILKSESPNWNQVVAECKQAEAALNTVHGYAIAQLQNTTVRDFAKTAVKKRAGK